MKDFRSEVTPHRARSPGPSLGELQAPSLSDTLNSCAHAGVCWLPVSSVSLCLLTHFISNCWPGSTMHVCLALASGGQTGLQDDRGQLGLVGPEIPSQFLAY